LKDRIKEMHINFDVTSNYIKSKSNLIDCSLRKSKDMDSSRIFDSGWQPKYDLQNGLKDAFTWFTTNITSA